MNDSNFTFEDYLEASRNQIIPPGFHHSSRYSPDQPRDELGRWMSEGGGHGAGFEGSSVQHELKKDPRIKAPTPKGLHNPATKVIDTHYPPPTEPPVPQPAGESPLHGPVPHIEGAIDAGGGARYIAWNSKSQGRSEGYVHRSLNEDMSRDVYHVKKEIKQTRREIKAARHADFSGFSSTPGAAASVGEVKLMHIADRVATMNTTLNHYAPERMPDNHPFVTAMGEHLRDEQSASYTSDPQARLDHYQASLIPLERARAHMERALREHAASGRPLISNTGPVRIKADRRYPHVNKSLGMKGPDGRMQDYTG